MAKQYGSNYGSEAFDEPNDEQGDVAGVGGHWREQCKDAVGENGTEDDPLSREHFGDPATR